MASKQILVAPDQAQAASKVASAVLDFIGKVPSSNKHRSAHPEQAARAAAIKASAQASLAAGTLALPPGPFGWLTIIPEIVAVWKIQAQMVADIATFYGKKSGLSEEQMIYCLFRHTAAQAVRDLVVRVGERVLVKQASLRMLQNIAQKIGVKISQRALGKGLSRWLPLLGAVGVAGYAYYDTAQVAKTAIELFASDISMVPEDLDSGNA